MKITDGNRLEITGELYDGCTKELIAVEVNGERFIPETNATRNADRIAELLRIFLTEEK